MQPRELARAHCRAQQRQMQSLPLSQRTFRLFRGNQGWPSIFKVGTRRLRERNPLSRRHTSSERRAGLPSFVAPHTPPCAPQGPNCPRSVIWDLGPIEALASVCVRGGEEGPPTDPWLLPGAAHGHWPQSIQQPEVKGRQPGRRVPLPATARLCDGPSAGSQGPRRPEPSSWRQTLGGAG